MISDFDLTQLPHLVEKQLTAFFPISDKEVQILLEAVPLAVNKAEYCFSKTDNKYFHRDNDTFFSPFHSGQWLIFLYFLANCASTNLTIINKWGGVNKKLADKIYYLNKILHSVDIYHEVELPRIMFFEHPIGTVIGRAKIGDGLQIYQGCTIGGNIENGIEVYPIIGENLTMYSNSKIVGRCRIGDNVTISANTYIKDSDIPSNSLVFGSSPNLIIKTRLYG